MTEIKCEECGKEFGSKEGLEHHKNAKHAFEVKKPLVSKKLWKYVQMGVVGLILLAVIIYGFGAVSSKKTLPPTTMQGHIEVNPPSHILKSPMQIEVQKHMLEHADAIEGGRGGVIINYDCVNYDCEAGLIEKLELFSLNHDHVYVAPYKNMKSKIAITKLNQIRTLDEYNEFVIKGFIGN